MCFGVPTSLSPGISVLVVGGEKDKTEFPNVLPFDVLGSLNPELKAMVLVGKRPCNEGQQSGGHPSTRSGS